MIRWVCCVCVSFMVAACCWPLRHFLVIKRPAGDEVGHFSVSECGSCSKRFEMRGKHLHCCHNRSHIIVPFFFFLQDPLSRVAPLIVTTIFREPARFRCSHNQIPCHWPKFSFPSVTGIVREDPMKQALI